MALFRDRPYVGAHFHVAIGNTDPQSLEAGFSEVVLPSGAIAPIRYRSGQDPVWREVPGPTRYNRIVLKRGFLGTLDLFEWWDRARTGGTDVRRTVVISLLTEDQSRAAATWKVVGAWPVSYELSKLDASEGRRVAIETVELAYESYTLQ